MESQAGQKRDSNNLQNPTEQRPEPSIRTMQSDIAEYMKQEKPSVVQILTKQAEYRPEKPLEEEKRSLPVISIIMIGATALVLLSAVGLISYWYFFSSRSDQAPPPETIAPTAPPSPIATEKTEIRVIQETASSLREALNDIADSQEKIGSFKRIVMQIKNSGGAVRFVTVPEMYRAIAVIPPQQISDSLVGLPLIAIHFSTKGPRAIFAAESQSRDRTFIGMLAWENALQRDWEVFFLGEPAPPALTSFTDRTFRNLDYRFMEIKQGLGIGYFIFPSKNLLVIATSEETIHTAIDRLFDAR